MPRIFPVCRPNFELLFSDGSWRQTWTHIVPGRYSDSPYTGLLFFEQSTGMRKSTRQMARGGSWRRRCRPTVRWAIVRPGRTSYRASSGNPASPAFSSTIATDAAVWSRLHRPVHGRSSIAFFHCGSSVTNLPPMRAAVRAITPITRQIGCPSATLPGTRKP
jgi:hypothetical protein